MIKNFIENANFEDTGFEKDADVIAYLKTYGFEEEMAYR